MQLTYYTDYSLRVLMYLGVHRGRMVNISEIAERYGVSRNHLVKVVHNLARGGFIKSYRGKGGGMTDAELDALFEQRFAYQKAYAANNLREIVALAHRHEIPLASHDDTTDENVSEAISHRVSVAEFPTTMEAARGLHEAGIDILMGAPNVVRGGSHSGNIAAVDLAREGLLDILSSDYVPSSLLIAALQLPVAAGGFTLPAAFATVSKTPAEAVGLTDRGEIAVGKRADLLQIELAGTMPVIRSVWRAGRRVA